jgi:hydrogenase maturation protein HypF
MTSRSIDEILVVGYGNELRRDDGAGPVVARAVEALKLPGVRALALPQLTPELAQGVSEGRAAIFVDAQPAGENQEVGVQPLAPSESAQIGTHASDPGAVLALARSVFGRSPPAWLVTVPAVDFGYGDQLSPSTKCVVPKAVLEVRRLCASLPGQFADAAAVERLRVAVRGAVQGVGFRPFIFRLAGELGLVGWVNNSAQGVLVEVEGTHARLEQFLLRLEKERPPRSFIHSLEATWLDPAGYCGFEIRPSVETGVKTALVMPDLATCGDCLREVFDPANRRYRYPFTNCTNCGPRFSIIERLPYDRPNTSMKRFAMCPQCQAEYDNPHDRRFHAQPNACPVCGPRLELWGTAGEVLSTHHAALQAAAAALRRGAVVAVKGLGGFHLMVAASDAEAVSRLRERKHREEKPFAVMFPSLESVRIECEVTALEERLLRSPEAPIVLVRRAQSGSSRPQSAIVCGVAPGNPYLGVMLPYTALHHLLLAELGLPVVATSGNVSDEPICTDEREALERLRGIADLFLVHDRPIARHVDDSIVRVIMGRELVLRRARGYAPLPVTLRQGGPPVLAVGAHLKNTIALAVYNQVFVSQHIGDLETELAYETFQRLIGDFKGLYESCPTKLAADAHPDYLSTKYAMEAGLPVVRVQHHAAHLWACMAENELEPPVLGVSWDGTGYGLDGTVWGGEFLLLQGASWQRVAHFRSFPLPGGEVAAKEPWRSALGLLYEAFGEGAFERSEWPALAAFSAGELAALKQMLSRKINTPRTSSAGRLFDAVASLVGLRQRVRFEGQAPMELEFAVNESATQEAYPFVLTECLSDAGQRAGNPNQPAGGDRRAPMILDWGPFLDALLADIAGRTPVGVTAAKFHHGLVEAIVLVARRVGQARVVLTGGCFQNRYLTECAVRRLQEAGFRPYWHQRVPPNDGGIALGQVVAALRVGG